MRVCSTFSGVGLLDLAFREAGHEIVSANEVNPKIAENYARNLGHKCTVGDIRKFSSPEADIVIGGIPCQPFSHSGKRKGRNDPRGSLYLEAVRFLEESGAKCFVFENVRGLLTDETNVLPHLIHLTERMGFSTEYRLLDSVDYGTAQFRERVIVVGRKGKMKYEWPKSTHFEDSEPKWRTVRNAIGDLPSPKGFSVVTDEELNEHRKNASFDNYYGVLDVERPSPTITRNAGSICDRCLLPLNHSGTNSRQDVMERYVENGESFGNYLVDLDRPARTIMENHGNSPILYETKKKYRRLTVRECMRLQDFPDWFTLTGSKALQYTMVGNAVPLRLGEAVARGFDLGSEPIHINNLRRFK